MSTSSLRIRRQRDRLSTIKQQWVQLEVSGILLLVPIAQLYRVVNRSDIGADLRLSHEGNPVPMINADRDIFGQTMFKESAMAIAILQGNLGPSQGKLAGLAIGAKPTLCRLGDDSFSPMAENSSFRHISQFIDDPDRPQYHLDIDSLITAILHSQHVVTG